MASGFEVQEQKGRGETVHVSFQNKQAAADYVALRVQWYQARGWEVDRDYTGEGVRLWTIDTGYEGGPRREVTFHSSCACT